MREHGTGRLSLGLPLGVVLMRDRRTEQRKDRVSHQPRDRAAVARHRRVDEGEGAVHDDGPIFRIELLGNRRRARDVSEQYRRELALAVHRPLLVQRLAAIAAEPCGFRVGKSAIGASQHGGTILGRFPGASC